MKRTSFLLFFAFLVFTSAYSQKRIPVTINGKKYVIPEFKEDSVQSFKNKFVKDGIIPSITESKALVEIRFFEEILFRGIVGRMYSIEYFPDSIVAKDITYGYSPYTQKEDSLYKFVGKDSAGFYIDRSIIVLSQKINWDSTLPVLINNRAFSLRDHYAILNDLMKKEASLIDPYKDRKPRHYFPNMVLEIKLNSQYRNIRINHSYSKANVNFPDFNCETNIGDIFYFLFNNIKNPKMKHKIFKMQFLVAFLLFCICHSNAQAKLDVGKVKGDPNFECNENLGILWDSSNNKLLKICDSKNHIEIRLTTYYLPHSSRDLIILTYNNEIWNAMKIKYTKGAMGHKFEYTIIELDPNTNKSNNPYFTVFDTLKVNNVFLLPDQETLNLTGLVNDGVSFTLSFKVDNKFRKYNFHSPTAFISDNPNVPELKQYIQIVKYLRSLFD